MKCILVLAAFILTACSTARLPAKLPVKRNLSEFGLAVKHVAANSLSDPPRLVLSNSATGSSLAEAKSLFTPDAVSIFGMPPEGDRFVVMVSQNGNTIAVHENVSDASPEEQITLFKRSEPNIWRTQSVLPPYRPPSDPRQFGYGTYGSSLSVDDKFLYYRFGEDGEVRKALLTSLKKAATN